MDAADAVSIRMGMPLPWLRFSRMSGQASSCIFSLRKKDIPIDTQRVYYDSAKSCLDFVRTRFILSLANINR